MPDDQDQTVDVIGNRGGVGRDLALSAVVLSGAEKGLKKPFTQRLTIGKAPDNDVVLTSAEVSRHHCEVTRVREGLRIRDLKSTNGTFVESARVQEAIVPAGSLIKVGTVEIAFRPNLDVLDVEPLESSIFAGAVAESPSMRRIFRVLDGVAKTDATVLLEGETGTGKEVMARAVHEKSKRKDGPFVIVDCGAVSYSLIESELFGHERGAFTSAVATRQGAFELAHGGTLFLDEIGELPLDVQPKLLRVLETRELRRVGGNKTFISDVRIVAATKRDLEREVASGKFREDLYFRLAVVPVRLPPLRARREDIPLLVDTILQRMGADPSQVSARTLHWLKQNDWPGNVRELRNLLERAVHISRATGQEEIRLLDMPTGGEAEDPFPFIPGESYRDMRARFDNELERRYLKWLLDRHHGNLSAAAREVQADRKHLLSLAKKHGLREGE
jgi:transcriptional regulator with GAF, ATPase, and Fis domain